MEEKTQRRRGRPKDEQKTYEMIHAAGQLFLEQGLQQSSMDAIARKANVSKQTLYTHFASKDELFRHVIKAKVGSYRLDDLTPVPEDLPVREALTRAGHSLLKLVTDQEAVDMMRVVIAECHTYPRIASLFYEEGPAACFSELESVIAQLHKRKQIRCPHPDKAAIWFASTCKGEVHNMLLMGIRPPRIRAQIKANIDLAVDLFLLVYAPQRA